MEPYNPEVRQGAAYFAKQIISYINAVGMIIGIIATNLADVIFGGIMLGLLWKDVDIIFGPPLDGWMLGFIASFAFWFIQLLMWQMIFTDHTISKADLIPLVLAVFVAVVDTNVDVAPVFMWIEASSIAATLKEITIFGNVTLYNLTLTSVIAGLYIVNGCSELFNAWYFSKTSDKNPIRKLTNKLQRSSSRPIPQSAPSAAQQAAARAQMSFPSIGKK